MRRGRMVVAILIALVAAPAAHAAVPGDLRLVNYYPARNGWTYMWDRWDARAIDADFARIRSLNGNAVRVIVQTDAFGYPHPDAAHRARLETMLRLAAAHGLRVELTLFDWWGSYKQVGRSQLWARELLAGYAADPRIACIELQNELEPKNAQAVAWAAQMIPFLRELGGGIPVTVSVSGQDPPGRLRALKTALGVVAPDFWSVHYYDKPELAYDVLMRAQQVAAPLPLYVGETGYWDGNSDPPVRKAFDRDDEQVRYLRTVENAASLLGLPAIAPWILSDFTRTAIPDRRGVTEYRFGLFRSDGRPKPAALAVRDLFAAGRDASFNQSFEEPLAGAEGQPAQWRRRGAGAFARDTIVSHGGVASARISGLRGHATALATFSAIPSTPWVTPGATLTATVWARGAGASGETSLSVWFFGANRHYLGRADSGSLPVGTTDWTQLTARAIAPPGAAYVRLVLTSTANRGSVWFDDVALS